MTKRTIAWSTPTRHSTTPLSPEFQVADLDDHTSEQIRMRCIEDYSVKQKPAGVGQILDTPVSVEDSRLRHTPSSMPQFETFATKKYPRRAFSPYGKKYGETPTSSIYSTKFFPQVSPGLQREDESRSALRRDQVGFHDRSLGIQELYHHAFGSLAELVTTLNCPQCDEVSSKLELREIVSQLRLWAKGLDFQFLERTRDRDTGLQLLIVRKLSNIADTVCRFNGCQPGSTDFAERTKALIQKYLHDSCEVEATSESTNLSDSEDSDSEDEAQPTDGLPKIANQHREHLESLDSLSINVNSLMSLLPTLHHYCSELQWATAVSQPECQEQTSTITNPFIVQIQDKFPFINAKLANRLGEANWSRFCRLRIANKPPTYDTSNNTDDWPPGLKDLVRTNPGRATFPSKFSPASQFHDSGLGSSRPNRSLYASSVMSHRSMVSTKSATGQGSARVPPTPPKVAEKIPFICKICGEELFGISNRIDWKLHVFTDLQPYICLDGDCKLGDVTFSTRKRWVDHQVSQHRNWEAWRHPDHDRVSHTEETLLNHYQTLNDPEVPLQSTHQVVTSHRTRTSIPQSSGHTCPICSRRQFKSLQEWTAHVCGHMEHIALSTLPQAVRSEQEDDDDDDDDDDGDQESNAVSGETKTIRKDHNTIDNDENAQSVRKQLPSTCQDPQSDFYPELRFSDPPLSEFLASSSGLGPCFIQQTPHFDGDIYTPRYKRRSAAGIWEGWCGYCQPGRWLNLKNSRYWEDKLRNHGICSRTRTFFEKPIQLRWIDDEIPVSEGKTGEVGDDSEKHASEAPCEKREGLCGVCNSWVPVDGMRKRGRGRCVAWWMHAYKCHEQSKLKSSGTAETSAFPPPPPPPPMETQFISNLASPWLESPDVCKSFDLGPSTEQDSGAKQVSNPSPELLEPFIWQSPPDT